jgi:hypothetical protein
MRRILALLASLVILIAASPSANAANLSVNLEVWSDLSMVQFDEGESIPPVAVIKKTLLKNCKSELDYKVGSRIRVLNQSRATVGIGALTSVKIGKVYKAIQPGYSTEEQINDEAPPNLYPSFLAPCLFTGIVNNLRSANFYTLYIGDGVTAEYDSVNLRKNNWKLNLLVEDVNCGNFENLSIPRGCNDD